jgi:hypothetical protein
MSVASAQECAGGRPFWCAGGRLFSTSGSLGSEIDLRLGFLERKNIERYGVGVFIGEV